MPLCRKKVGLLGFACRCGGVFCATHRLYEDHACPDLGRVIAEKLAAAPPASPIQHPKVQRI